MFTDPVVARLECFAAVLDSLQKEGIDFEVYDQCRVEPTDKWYHAGAAVPLG